jgi:integrase
MPSPKKGKISPKSRPGRRTAATPGVLKPYLEAQSTLSADRSGPVFGCSATQPFSDSGHRARAKRLWTEAGLYPLGFHEARHTYASLMIASGVNAKTLSTMMGRSSITITLDRYGHLFPGAETEAAAKLDAYLQMT